MTDQPHRGAAVVGVASAVPEREVGNAEIAAQLGVDESWIARRTGTRVRHVADPDARLDEFASRAACDALDDAGLDVSCVDLVLVATTSSEEMSPHAAPLVAESIGARGSGAIDISAACPGFLSALALATSMVETGRAHTAVCVGADLLSRYLDPHDRGSAMLFGDGTGAVVLTAIDSPSRVGPVRLHSDGAGRHLIRLERGDGRIFVDGHPVFRSAVQQMSDVTIEVLDAADMTPDDVDLFVYHQANSRIIDAVGKRLRLDGAKVVDVVGEFANTSAASLPIALAWAYRHQRLHSGDRVLLSAFGAGMVWGACLLSWGRPDEG
jgi:3-oxoacyl-[acyl-carrier-protein] synthase-3